MIKNNILPLRSQANVRNAWLKQRLDEVLPDINAARGTGHVDRDRQRVQ